MSLDNPVDRLKIQKIFPLLASVQDWKITSPVDYKYNCIAWAGIKDNIWWWPEKDLDGIDWPFNLPYDTTLDTFVKLFQHMNYETCNSHVFEKNFQKIAIYINTDTQQCTHAARQQLNGKWTSKLGPMWDIDHPDPFVIEGNDYGKVAVILKRKRD